MQDADRPIVTHSQDRLGRSTFAQYLARSILDQQSKESFVIGLFGGIGTGKTSLINLTLEELRFAASNMEDAEKPVILNFSPWSYSGQNQLIYSFFRRLSSELHQSPFLENADKIIHLLELYVSFFTHKPVPKSLRPKHNFLTRLFRRNLITSETYGWEAGRDLTQVKAELNHLLRAQQHKIIIVIDNISRLDEHEVNQIFQIVKSIGDYANTVYMLAIDKKQILPIVNRATEGYGEDYLQKIIQLPFYIPAISLQDLETLFVEKINHLLTTIPTENWNKEYWADLYYTTIKYFFNNVRDITNYINTLSFSYVHVKDVVNPVDFFAITAVEVFLPKIYSGIRGNKDLFTDLMDDVYQLDEQKIAEDKSRCDEILSRTDKISKEALIHFLIQLFPRLRHIYQDDIAMFHSEAIARKNKRICTPDMFEIYFRLSLPTGVILEPEFNAILAMTKDEKGFALALLRLNQDERITKFIDLLDSLGIMKISKENIGNVINALLDGADLFPEGEASPARLSTPDRVHRIIHRLLRRIDNNEKRFELLRNAIQNAINSIYILVHEIKLQSQEHIETEDTFLPLEHRDLTTEQLTILQKLVATKILYWAEIGRLIEHPKLLPILYAWKTWGDEIECRRYVAQATQEDKGLLAFLCAVFKEPIDEAITKYEKIPEWQKYLVDIENFISPAALEAHAKMLFEDISFEQLREREQLALLIFLDLINAKTVKVIPKTSG